MSNGKSGRSGVGVAVLALFGAAGAVLFCLGLLVRPDSSYHEDRGLALVGGAALLLGSLALLGLSAWLAVRSARREAARRLKADAMFRLTGARVAPEVYAINHELFERFQVRFAPDDPPVEASALTAGELARRVLQKVRADEAAGRRPLGPAHFGLVRKAVASVAGVPAGDVQSCGRLDDVLPRRRRRIAWRRLQGLFNTPLPRMKFVAAVMWAYVATAAALSLAVVAPAGWWVYGMELERVGGDFNPRALVPWLAAGVGAVLGAMVLAVMTRAGGHRLWRVPDECRTVGRLTALLFPFGRRPSELPPEQAWTPEAVWGEVRAAVATVRGFGEAAVSETTMLGRDYGSLKPGTRRR